MKFGGYVGVVLLIGVCWVGLDAARTVRIELASARPSRRHVTGPPPTFSGVSGRVVSFPTRDKVVIAAWYYPSRNGAAVALVHGHGGNRVDMMPEAELFVSRGYGVLALDSRAHGESGGDLDTYGDRERADISAALDFLSAQADVLAGHIALLGFSSGTSQLALVATTDKRVAALVLEAPVSSLVDFCDDEYGRWSWLLRTPVAVATMRWLDIDVDAVSIVRTIPALAPRALLVVHGGADPVIPVARARQVFEAAGEPKQLLVVPDAGHGDYLKSTSADVAGALLEFLDRHLAPPA